MTQCQAVVHACVDLFDASKVQAVYAEAGIARVWVARHAMVTELSFTQGLLIGQLSVVLLIGAFIKFFIFGEASSPARDTSRKSSYTKHIRTPSLHSLASSKDLSTSIVYVTSQARTCFDQSPKMQQTQVPFCARHTTRLIQENPMQGDILGTSRNTLPINRKAWTGSMYSSRRR